MRRQNKDVWFKNNLRKVSQNTIYNPVTDDKKYLEPKDLPSDYKQSCLENNISPICIEKEENSYFNKVQSALDFYMSTEEKEHKKAEKETSESKSGTPEKTREEAAPPKEELQLVENSEMATNRDGEHQNDGSAYNTERTEHKGQVVADSLNEVLYSIDEYSLRFQSKQGDKDNQWADSL